MYAKISLTHHTTGEERVVMFTHDYGDNPTAILDNYEAQHPTYIRARPFSPQSDTWHYRLEQNFTEVNYETLIHEWQNYRDTARFYTGLYVASGIVFGLLKSHRPLSLYEIYTMIQGKLVETKESKTPYALDRNRVFDYFLSECEAIGVTNGLPTSRTKKAH